MVFVASGEADSAPHAPRPRPVAGDGRESAAALPGRKPDTLLLLPLLGTDMAFIGLHVLYAVGMLHNGDYSIAQDRGYAEVFQYVKLYWIALGLTWLAARDREPLYGAWCAIFLYLLVDDALKVHEQLGRTMAADWPIFARFGDYAQAYAEVLVALAIGACILALVAAGHWRAAPSARRVSNRLLLLLALLALVAVGLDLLHALAPDGLVGLLLTIGEDGGELVVVSIVCWYVLGLAGSQHHPVAGDMLTRGYAVAARPLHAASVRTRPSPAAARGAAPGDDPPIRSAPGLAPHRAGVAAPGRDPAGQAPSPDGGSFGACAANSARMRQFTKIR